MIMKEDDIKFIRQIVFSLLLHIMDDFTDTEKIVDMFIDEVIEDVEETADPDNWGSEDVRIALARAIKKKLSID